MRPLDKWGSITKEEKEKLLSQIEQITESGCWIYMGRVGNDGYGRVWMCGYHRLAHRASYIIVKGQIPKGMTIDHLCRVRCCINPNHLEAVPNEENVLRGVSFGATNKLKRFCVHGHEFNQENTYVFPVDSSRPGHRLCRECLRQASRKNGSQYKLNRKLRKQKELVCAI